jgi:hypothetical protein
LIIKAKRGNRPNDRIMVDILRAVSELVDGSSS